MTLLYCEVISALCDCFPHSAPGLVLLTVAFPVHSQVIAYIHITNGASSGLYLTHLHMARLPWMVPDAEQSLSDYVVIGKAQESPDACTSCLPIVTPGPCRLAKVSSFRS
jgi:hypothetical protein